MNNLDTTLLVGQIENTKKYIQRLFENLKFHIIELNELLHFEEKKIYRLMKSKVKLMLELYIIDCVVTFVE